MQAISAKNLTKMNEQTQTASVTFGKYEVFIIAILAIMQFTVILDFMVLSPLGAIMMPELSIDPSQFGLVVSAYAFSAGASGLFAAGFADKFDRKKLLLFFYAGFIVGTLFCALAPTYHFLLGARVVTGLFGGVLGSISFAIITDLFNMEVRGRVMGFVQMAFAASQILGIPIGLYLANDFGWHSPFWMIVGFSILVAFVIFIYMKPIDAHLKLKAEHSAFQHLMKTVSTPDYLFGFATTTLLATGGFMLMPFASAFSTYNLGIPMNKLPMLYLVTGIATMIFGPLTGKLSDKIGKFNIFLIGSIITMACAGIYTSWGITPLWIVMLMNVIMFIGVSSRIISSSALLTAVPAPQDRGAFMSINSATQQISGGIGSAVAGLIVVENADHSLSNYPILGYVVIAASAITVVMMYFLNKKIQKKVAAAAHIANPDKVVV